MSKRIRYVCALCGSKEVLRNAQLEFNEATQEFETLELLNSWYCLNCGLESSFTGGVKVLDLDTLP